MDWGIYLIVDESCSWIKANSTDTGEISSWC
jgi:hypothetical protein